MSICYMGYSTTPYQLHVDIEKIIYVEAEGARKKVVVVWHTLSTLTLDHLTKTTFPVEIQTGYYQNTSQDVSASISVLFWDSKFTLFSPRLLV